MLESHNILYFYIVEDILSHTHTRGGSGIPCTRCSCGIERYREMHLFIESSERDGRTKPSGPDRCVCVIVFRCASSVPIVDSRRAGIGLHEAGSGR